MFRFGYTLKIVRNTIVACLLLILAGCNRDEEIPLVEINHELNFEIPRNFPAPSKYFMSNKPTEYGVKLGKKLFHDKRLSADNSISCASCHRQSHAFADPHPQSIGIYSAVHLRNALPIQNMAFLKTFMWDGNVIQLEHQAIIPIISRDEMGSSILQVIGKIQDDREYRDLFRIVYGSEEMTGKKIYESLAQYEYTLVSANSKYDKVMRQEGATFTPAENRGYQVFQNKCSTCHSTDLFTDQSFRNVGFPRNPNVIEERGRARVTGKSEDLLKFRVPSLRNVAYTAPYGSWGQFPTLESVLDYFDNGVLMENNLDPILKNNNGRIPLSSQEKKDLISFMKTLSDPQFIRP